MRKQLHFAALFGILYLARGSDSVVECHLAKVKVAGPNPVSRSNRKGSRLCTKLATMTAKLRTRRVCALSSAGRATDS